jgi:hypothetical protein
MSNRFPRGSASALLATLALLLLPVLGHTHGGDEGLEAFHEHLDDYAQEVDRLSARFHELVDRRVEGEDLGDAELDGLIDAWEEVDVHLAIERKATPLYPGIWQALIGFRQAAEAGAPVAELRDRADAVRAALLQGLGGVRLAASQVDRAAPSGSAPESMDADASLDAILEGLDAAVAAYEADDPARAESLIHRVYMERFEGLEGDLIEQDPELVSDLEAAFNARLPLLIQDGAALDAVQAEVRDMKQSLERSRELLQGRDAGRSEVF